MRPHPPALPRRLAGPLAAAPLGLCLLLSAALIGLAELPYHWLSAWGFRLQRLWTPAGAAARPPWLWLLPALATTLFVLLAWGPLARGRGGGITGVLALQGPGTEAQRRNALTSLSLGCQLQRLPLLALTHLAGLSVGTESPSAALGAAILLGLRARLAPLRRFSPPLMAAIGGGAGLGAAFRSPLLGAAYALEELSAERGFSLVAPTLGLAGVGMLPATLLNTELGQPARHGIPPAAVLPPAQIPLALLIGALAAAAGVLLVRVLIPLARCLAAPLHRRPLLLAPVLGLLFALLAVASDGLSLNDGSLLLGPALEGHAVAPWWAAVPRLLGPWLSIAIGAPGGLMHDAMSLGAVLVGPWLAALPAEQHAALAAIAAVAVFSSACRTPLFCALFVFTLQGQVTMLPALLTTAALAAGFGRRFGGPSWNEVQLAGSLSGSHPPAEQAQPAPPQGSAPA